MSTNKTNSMEFEEVDSEELRLLLEQAYELFPDQFQNVCVSEEAKANFPELDVIERLRDERDSHEERIIEPLE